MDSTFDTKQIGLPGCFTYLVQCEAILQLKTLNSVLCNLKNSHVNWNIHLECFMSAQRIYAIFKFVCDIHTRALSYKEILPKIFATLAF